MMTFIDLLDGIRFSIHRGSNIYNHCMTLCYVHLIIGLLNHVILDNPKENLTG